MLRRAATATIASRTGVETSSGAERSNRPEKNEVSIRLVLQTCPPYPPTAARFSPGSG